MRSSVVYNQKNRARAEVFYKKYKDDWRNPARICTIIVYPARRPHRAPNPLILIRSFLRSFALLIALSLWRCRFPSLSNIEGREARAFCLHRARGYYG